MGIRAYPLSHGKKNHVIFVLDFDHRSAVENSWKARGAAVENSRKARGEVVVASISMHKSPMRDTERRSLNKDQLGH